METVWAVTSEWKEPEQLLTIAICATKEAAENYVKAELQRTSSKYSKHVGYLIEEYKLIK